MRFFKPAWQSANKEKALKATEKISKQATLVKIALSEEYACQAVRYLAVTKLTDESVLATIAKSNKQIEKYMWYGYDRLSDARFEAVEK